MTITSPSSCPFVFFDLGQTLIDEWDYIAYFDQKFLELLNGFGARIDQRNYQAIRDSIIRDRKIGHGSVKELVIEVCKLLSPLGYEKVIASRLESEIRQGRRDLFKFFDDAEPTLQALSKYCGIGIIANQSEDILELALREAGQNAEDCIMVGDRLDTDICPANNMGMTTIRTTNSLFALQIPKRACEHPSYTVAHLSEIPELLE